MKASNNKKLIGAGVLAAIAASLCCITPVLALLAGISGIASAFSWLEPARPYFIAITALVLGFAWYQKLKPKSEEEIQCECEADEKPSYWQSKNFLGWITAFAIIMTAFPYYSSVFYPDNKPEVVIVNQSDIETLDLDIEGMTCSSCESHIVHAANEVEGVIYAKANYKTGTAEIEFDKSKTTKEKIVKSVNATGYTVVGEKLDK